MIKLRLVRSVGLVLVGTIGVWPIGARQGLAGSFVGTYKFDGSSLAAIVEATNAAEAPTLSNFLHQTTVSPTTNGFRDGSLAGQAGSDDGYQAKYWVTNTIDSASNYFEFSVTPQKGTLMTLSSLVFDHMRTAASGATNWGLRSSLDNYAGLIGQGSIARLPNISDSWAGSSFLGSVSFGSQFANLTGSLTFRLYAYGTTSADRIWALDNVQVQGTVAGQSQANSLGAATAVPTPAIVPALVSFGWGLWRRRRMA